MRKAYLHGWYTVDLRLRLPMMVVVGMKKKMMVIAADLDSYGCAS